MKIDSNIDWEDILYTLGEGKCILFLGSNAYQAPNGGDIETALIKWLGVDQPDHPFIRLYNQDGFYLFKKNRYKRRVVAKIKEFYNQAFPALDEDFKKLAQIPFSAIFSLTTDNILARTFDSYDLSYSSDFYFRNRKTSEHFEKPSKDSPLIYNLLGNIEEPESLILTHNDFFDYLESIFIGNNMSEELRYEIEVAERYIFLGLPYEKWYFQLLLRILSMHSDKLKEIERLALREFEDQHLYEMYHKEFNIEFIPTDITGFISDLYSYCEKENLLKTISQNNVNEDGADLLSLQEVKNLIAKAETKKAISSLKAYLDQLRPRSLKLNNELIVLSHRYNMLMQRDKRGSIYPKDLIVENNQVVEQLLEVIAKASKL